MNLVKVFSIFFILNFIYLQNQKKKILTSQENDELNSLPSNTIAFAGGGFRAHGVHSAILSCLLNKKNNVKLSDLFKNINNISSNSGGSWFSSQLFYSKKFITMIENIGYADNQNDAINFYVNDFIKPLENTFKDSSLEFENIFQEFIDDLESLVGEIIYAIRFGLKWTEFVEKIIKATTDDFNIENSLNDQEPHDWLTNKTWTIASSIATQPEISTINQNPILLGIKDKFSLFSKGNENLLTTSPLSFQVTLQQNDQNKLIDVVNGCSDYIQSQGSFSYEIREEKFFSPLLSY